MNFIWIFLVVGGVSLVECEVDGGFYTSFIKPSEQRHFVKLHKDEWKPDEMTEAGKNYNERDISPRKEIETKFVSESTEGENENGKKNDLAEGLSHFKSIYHECKAKVNKRLEKVFQSKVKSSVDKYLSDSKEYALSLYKCVKVFSFRHLDEVLEENLIPVTDYAYFVKDGINETQDFPTQNRGRKISLWSDKMKFHKSINEYAMNVLTKDWNALIFERLENLLRSHSLKFQIDKPLKTEGRGRRRDHRMFAMMVMGFMIMASILIPMGFQFLTVLGGKSLLMAKMALIMSAINGLKKIATSNVGYGFYHTGNDGHHHDHIHHGFHEKVYHVNPQNSPSQYGFNL